MKNKDTKENDSSTVEGYGIFTDIGDTLQVVCLDNKSLHLKDWKNMDPSKVFIYWSNSIDDFLNFIRSTERLFNGIDEKLFTIELYMLHLKKINNIIEIL